MAKEKGIDVALKVDVSGTMTKVAGFTTSSITIDGNRIDISSGDEPDWEEHVVGRRNWSISHEGRLVTSSGSLDTTLDALLQAALNGNKISVEVQLGANGPTASGTASIMPFEVNGTDGDAAQVTAELQGDGALSI